MLIFSSLTTKLAGGPDAGCNCQFTVVDVGVLYVVIKT